MRTIHVVVQLGVAIIGARPAVAQFPTIRLAVVHTPEETGLLAALLPDFERESGYRVVVYSGEDVHEVARNGAADLVISHYGHPATEAFMTQGLGLWPRAVFANQIALVGPASDPARVRGLQNTAEVFRRIAGSGSRFVANSGAVSSYLEAVLWEAAGRPAKDAWFVSRGVSEADGLQLAAELKAYYIFGLPPFLEWKETCEGILQAGSGTRRPVRPIEAPDIVHDRLCDMDALVVAPSLPHRVMMSMVVNPQRVAAINVSGATALQEYLLRPAVQARIENFRHPRTTHQIWKGAAVQNSGAALGFGRRP
jgi:tungstate transport system substrate-binding protein